MPTKVFALLSPEFEKENEVVERPLLFFNRRRAPSHAKMTL
jgi:hypothetical protein